MNTSISDLRQNYTLDGLTEAQADSNPFKQFEVWFNQAILAQLNEPNAMTLATVNHEGKPSARMVLLKNFNEDGFVFFTNYESQKGSHLQENPWAALVFWWAQLERQVRIEGKVEKITEQESNEYFQNRPKGSQLGAYASEQSKIIESREILQERLEYFAEKFQDKNIPCPSNWGGFRVIPSKIEFWQGRTNRLHDRLCYTLQNDGNWLRQRLSP